MTGGSAENGEWATRRESHALWAAALANGPAELVDFVLPLWSGLELGLSATEAGILMALEMAVSVLVRPLAGVLADTRDRRRVAAVGAVLYGVACVGYAVAGAFAVAAGAAVLSGVGGALLWVTVRAMVGERLAEDSAVYPRLMGAQENGAWVAFLTGLSVLGVAGFPGLFHGCAAACLLAAAMLLTAPRRRAAPSPATAGGRGGGAGLVRGLRPMLLAVAFTMTAEAAVAMLLLLHLERGFGMGVVEAAYVFLPGAIVMGLLPERLHALVVRFGRTRLLAAASVSSAGFAVGLAWAPNPWVIAGLWVLSGVAWAVVIPVQEAVIAEASGGRIGRGMGLYEAAALVGAAVGALAAGILYDASSWTVACLVASCIILAGAVVVPRAVRSLGVAEHPPPAPVRPERPERAPSAAAGATEAPAPGPAAAAEIPEAPVARAPAAGPGPRRQLAELAAHAALFAGAHVALGLADLSWLVDLATEDTRETLLRGNGAREDLDDGLSDVLYGAGRIWVFVLLVDVAVRGYRMMAATARAR
ncbi:MFS transporter [Streptomyces sp. B6B3]|uniref:MFS transporter n=1 Tax=Streptomyces sp. B6B3 TaxID=3153570 RepID=UPI00325CD270